MYYTLNKSLVLAVIELAHKIVANLIKLKLIYKTVDINNFTILLDKKRNLFSVLTCRLMFY